MRCGSDEQVRSFAPRARVLVYDRNMDYIRARSPETVKQS